MNEPDKNGHRPSEYEGRWVSWVDGDSRSILGRVVHAYVDRNGEMLLSISGINGRDYFNVPLKRTSLRDR